MKASLTLIGLLLTSLSLPSCVSAEIDLENVEITHKNLSFPGVPSEVPDCSPEVLESLAPAELGSPTIAAYEFPTQTFVIPSMSNVLPSGAKATLRLARVVVRSHDNGVSFASLHDIRLTLASPRVADGNPQTVADYSNVDGSESAPGELTIPVTNTQLDLDPANVDSYVFSLTASAGCGILPRQAWSVDVTLSLSGSAEFKY